MGEVKQATDRILIAGLPQSLRSHIDKLLDRGMSKLSIKTAVEAFARKAAGDDPSRGKLVIAGVEAYLETK